MTTTHDFLAAIAAEPNVDLHRLAYADRLDESGQSAEACQQRLTVALRHVIAAPADDAPRLAYADVCEAYRELPGMAERSEFIRCQVDIAAAEARGDVHSGRPGVWKGCDCSTCALRRREGELLEAGGLRHLPGPFYRKGDEYGFSINGAYFRCTFHRGFIAEITLPCASWCGERCRHCGEVPGQWAEQTCTTCHGTGVIGRHATRLVRAAPLEYVTLAGKEPLPPGELGDKWAWEPGLQQPDPHQIPMRFIQWPDTDVSFIGYLMLCQFDTRQEALDWLSKRALRWARLAAEQEDVRRKPCACPSPLKHAVCRRCARLRELARLVG